MVRVYEPQSYESHQSRTGFLDDCIDTDSYCVDFSAFPHSIESCLVRQSVSEVVSESVTPHPIESCLVGEPLVHDAGLDAMTTTKTTTTTTTTPTKITKTTTTRAATTATRLTSAAAFISAVTAAEKSTKSNRKSTDTDTSITAAANSVLTQY